MATGRAEVIEIRSQRGTWLFVGLGLGLLGVFTFILGIGAAVADGFGMAERLVFGIGGVIAGVLLTCGAYLALRMGRTVPELHVFQDGLSLHHGGLLRAPLVVTRAGVEEVVQRSATVDETPTATVCPSSELLPDFSTPIGTPGRQWNGLVILRRELVLRDVRRGVAAAAFIADRFSGYSGPVPHSVVNGFLFEAKDPDQIRRSFESWAVLADRPSPQALMRIGAPEAGRRMKRR